MFLVEHLEGRVKNTEHGHHRITHNESFGSRTFLRYRVARAHRQSAYTDADAGENGNGGKKTSFVTAKVCERLLQDG
jgi:hypothetical protein